MKPLCAFMRNSPSKKSKVHDNGFAGAIVPEIKRPPIGRPFDIQKKKHCFRSASNLFGRLDRAGNLTGTQTAGTNIDMAGRTIDDSLHALDVGLPGTIGTTVRVGNSDTERNTLVAKLALCHPLHLLAVIKSRLGHSQAVDTITDCITKCKYYFQKR